MYNDEKSPEEEFIDRKRAICYKTYGNADASVIRTVQNAISLTKDLYQENGHFLYELIQNVDDNPYPSRVANKVAIFSLQQTNLTNISPSYGDFVLMCNEEGFQQKDVDSVCDIGNVNIRIQPLTIYLEY